MQFQTPAWFLALGALPALTIFLLWNDKRQQRSWQSFVAPKLRAKLVKLSAKRRRWVVRSLLLLSAGLSIIALARPYWGSETLENAVSGRQVLLAIDISRSMLTQDVQPSRLDFVRVSALEVVDSLPDERIGLAAFASDAFLLSPLTIDHDAIRESLAALDPELMPRKGSKLNQALELALRTYRRSAAESKLLVIFSDGEAHVDLDEGLVKEITEQGIRVICLGIGTDQGGSVLVSSEDQTPFIDKDGRIIRSAYEAAQLQELAKSTEGTHTRLSPGQSAVPIIMEALADIEDSPGESRFREVPTERFHWFLFPAMILAVLAALLNTSSARRISSTSATSACLALLLLSSHESRADLFGSAEKQAIESFSQGRDLIESDPAESRQRFAEVLLSPNAQHQQLAHINLAHLQLQEASRTLFNRDSQGKVAPLLPAAEILRLIDDADTHLASARSIASGNYQAIGQHETWSRRLKQALKQYPTDAQAPPKPPENQPGDDNKNPEAPTPKNEPNASGKGQDQSQKKGGDPDDKQKPNSQDSKKEGQPDLTPRPGETPEEQARRILSSHSDLRGPQKRKPHPLGIKPDKDW